MPTSNSQFDGNTTAEQVAGAFAGSTKGKTVLITGANSGGIGGPTAEAIASHAPKIIILAGRTASKIEETTAAIKKINANIVVKPIELDLVSQESCRTAAQRILEDEDIHEIDILINNAGIMATADRRLSPEGIEGQFATNHIGHFLFTNLIMPKILKSAATAPKGSTRIVNVSSRGVLYGPVRFSDINLYKIPSELPETERPNFEAMSKTFGPQKEQAYSAIVAYAQSKSANVLFSVQLNKLLFEKHGILSPSLHPGLISTELSREIPPERLEEIRKQAQQQNRARKSLSQGASTTLVAALDPSLQPEDAYLSDCQVADWTPRWATDPALAERLWSLSEELVKEKFSY